MYGERGFRLTITNDSTHVPGREDIVPIPEREENHYPIGWGECPYPRRRRDSLFHGEKRMCLSQNERRVSLSQEQRRVSVSQEEGRLSLSHEEKRFPNHVGEETRLPCTSHGERGSRIYLS